MARYKEHISCTNCGSRDNRALYDDGSSFCFGCKKYFPASKEDRLNSYQRPVDDESRAVYITGTTSFPPHIVTWLEKYSLTIPEILSKGVRYNEQTNQLIFPLYDEAGTLKCTQARNFQRSPKSKYTNFGPKEEAFPLYKTQVAAGTRSLVITEDLLSAYKVSRQVDSFCALGVSVSKPKIVRFIRLGYSKIIIWLDKDKWREAMEIADLVKWLGVSAKAILTELDPKEYSDEQIKGYLK